MPRTSRRRPSSACSGPSTPTRRGPSRDGCTGITTNLFLDQARRRARLRIEPIVEQHLPTDWQNTPDRQFEHAQLAPDIQRALDTLPPGYRAAVVLCDIEGYSYAEVAATLGVKLGTVQSRLHRGRAMLREQLAHRQEGR